MMNLLMKRKAWLRAARMLAVCMIVMGAMVLLSSEAKAQCGCITKKTDSTVVVTIDNCPLTILYDKLDCDGVETVYIKKITFDPTGCCTRLFTDRTIAYIVQSVGQKMLLTGAGFGGTGYTGRVSKLPCWQKSTTGLFLTPCSTSPCCWIQGTIGNSYTSTSTPPIPPVSCTSPCEYVCE